jgi:hypothetical protein
MNTLYQNFNIFQIYLVIWYWYVVLIILGAARVGCRVVQYFSGGVRFWLMKMKMHRFSYIASNLIISATNLRVRVN